MKSKALRVSSIISWLWGVLLFLMALSVGYPFIIQDQVTGQLIVYLSVMLFVSILMCLSGLGLWRQKRPFNAVTIFSIIILFLYSLFFKTLISLFSILVGVVILVVVLVKWKEFA